MTQPVANCPNCGAKIVFRWSSSVQTVCDFCKSILVRTDVDLKKVGQVADLPPDNSPIQINSEGKYGNKAFVVVGRILYEYDQGGWIRGKALLKNAKAACCSAAKVNSGLLLLWRRKIFPPPHRSIAASNLTWTIR